jgi:PRC-barrel domain protein
MESGAAAPFELAGLVADRYPRATTHVGSSKGTSMYKIALALLISMTLTLPASAQKKDEATKGAAKIPTNTFFKGQQPNQYLARERLIGVKVVNKDNQTIGTIDDLILSSGGQVEGVILGVGGFLGVGEKKIGVRITALRISASDGKTTITFPNATKEMLGAVEAYQRAGATSKK